MLGANPALDHFVHIHSTVVDTQHIMRRKIDSPQILAQWANNDLLFWFKCFVCCKQVGSSYSMINNVIAGPTQFTCFHLESQIIKLIWLVTSNTVSLGDYSARRTYTVFVTI